MFKYYLRSIFRQLKNNKIYSFINITGLSLGFATCFIIILYVAYQLSYDKHNKNYDDTYLVTSNLISKNRAMPRTPFMLGRTVKDNFPAVKEYAQWEEGSGRLKHKNKVFDERNCVFSDLRIFNILDLPIINGEIKAAVSQNDYIILSEKLAKKYFGDINPVGETLTFIYEGNNYDLKITAVMKDIPRTSTFTADFIAPLSIYEECFANSMKTINYFPRTSWDGANESTYIQLYSGTNVAELENKINEFTKGFFQKERRLYHFLPMKDIYFTSADWEIPTIPSGDRRNVLVYSTAAFLILLIACINYLMLSLGGASLRVKEIGVKKILGANRFSLLKQTLIEAVVIALLSLPPAIILVQLFTPGLSELMGTPIGSTFFHTWGFIFIFLSIVVLIGVISGLYIFFYLAKLNPINVLKMKHAVGRGGLFSRRTMLVSQMVVFIGLLFSSLTFYRQLKYIADKDLGFNNKDLLMLYLNNKDLGANYEAFRNELKQNANIVNVSRSDLFVDGSGLYIDHFRDKNNSEKRIDGNALHVDNDFVETMELTMLAGESFKGRTEANAFGSVIINESAMKETGLTNPIGEIADNRNKIIGVVKDFHLLSLHDKINPTCLMLVETMFDEVLVRINPVNQKATLDYIKETAKKYCYGASLKYDYYDEALNTQYTRDLKFSKVIALATIITIFVACLGIFGMSVFVSQQRIKEVAIRKVLGASIKNVYYVITKEFLYLALVASAIILPATNYLMNLWLQNFYYRVNINMWYFAASIAAGLLIVFGTISFQTWKVSKSNPIDIIKNE
jgi:putative ABC transport system permease protein